MSNEKKYLSAVQISEIEKRNEMFKKAQDKLGQLKDDVWEQAQIVKSIGMLNQVIIDGMLSELGVTVDLVHDINPTTGEVIFKTVGTGIEQPTNSETP